MPLRGWEFILGGAAPSLAFAIRRMPVFIIHLLAIAGACLIAIAVFLFDADTLYPSYRAAVPTIGAALLIVTGLLEPRTVVAPLWRPGQWCQLALFPTLGTCGTGR